MATVLIADDDIAVRELLETKLSTEGFHIVAQASNGVDAVRLANHHMPDVVVMDLMMPWVNGFDAIKEIASACPGTRILVFSALDELEDEDMALTLGADGYLRKGSTSPNEIAIAIRDLAAAAS